MQSPSWNELATMRQGRNSPTLVSLSSKVHWGLGIQSSSDKICSDSESFKGRGGSWYPNNSDTETPVYTGLLFYTIVEFFTIQCRGVATVVIVC